MTVPLPRPGRRPLLAAGIASLGALALPSAPALAAATLPSFRYGGEITTDLAYEPTGEFIFPSIFHAAAHLESPLGNWYLYYAPHERPGGICLMYADSLDGPWIEHAQNPLIENLWEDHYDVTHVSSPDAFWHAQEQQLFLYFHGENTTTRFATSKDGISFEYGDVAVHTSMVGPDATEASYARVFEHPDPRSAHRYGMFFMENTTANHRRIRLAESVDARSWTVRPGPVVTPGPLDGGNVSGANLWEWRGGLYVLYHGSTGVSFARPIDRTLTQVGAVQVLHHSSGAGEDAGRVAAPEVVTDRGTTYLFYEKGARLDATVAFAVAEG